MVTFLLWLMVIFIFFLFLLDDLVLNFMLSSVIWVLPTPFSTFSLFLSSIWLRVLVYAGALGFRHRAKTLFFILHRLAGLFGFMLLSFLALDCSVFRLRLWINLQPYHLTHTHWLIFLCLTFSVVKLFILILLFFFDELKKFRSIRMGVLNYVTVSESHRVYKNKILLIIRDFYVVKQSGKSFKSYWIGTESLFK